MCASKILDVIYIFRSSKNWKKNHCYSSMTPKGNSLVHSRRLNRIQSPRRLWFLWWLKQYSILREKHTRKKMKWAILFPSPISNLLIQRLSVIRIAIEAIPWPRNALSTFQFTIAFVTSFVVDKIWQQLKNLISCLKRYRYTDWSLQCIQISFIKVSTLGPIRFIFWLRQASLIGSLFYNYLLVETGAFPL